MGISIGSGRCARAATAALKLFCASLLVAACAANSYVGVPFAPGAAAPELQTLARRAQSGDRWAQLELGIRYEEGRGVPANRNRALRLYRLASTASGGQTFLYSPPVRGSPGAVFPVDLGPRQPGLIEARLRLQALKRATEARR